MAFDFTRAIALATASMEQKALECLVLGPSGAGKSYVMGTFGVPTLYIYSSGESHGPKAAAECAREGNTGSTIIPVCMDVDENDKRLQGDEVLARVAAVLGSAELLDHHRIGAIVVDGAAELEIHIRESNAFEEACKTDKGKHNTFAEPSSTCALFRPIFNQLKDLQRRRGTHFAMTCMLDVKEYGEWGDIVDAQPRLKGFSVAEMLVQQFGDVLVVGKMTANGLSKWQFQFMTDIHKASKDLAGTVKRAVNYSPRINGCKHPSYVAADFREILKLKGAQ